MTEKPSKRYFLPYGLREHRVQMNQPLDEVIVTVKQLPGSKYTPKVKKSFQFYFLNWGGVFLIVFGIIVGIIRVLQYEPNWETVDPDILPDYALASAGASIIGQPVAKTYYWKDEVLTKWILPDSSPTAILQPWKSPGECWAFAGQTATIRIRLSHLIIPKLVTIDHIAKEISPTGNIKSAPKGFAVFGVDGSLLEYMGDFEFTGDGTTQTFQLHPETKLDYPYRMLQFQFYSNHGHPLYTCVYKIRVHGIFFKY